MIYYDNAASTFLCESAKKIMQQDFANPSSPHILGIEAERAIKFAKMDLAKILSCDPDEIVFTSGGTESNNLGIIGAAKSIKSARGRDKPMRILATDQEHPSVTESLDYLVSLPGYSVTYAPPSQWNFTEDVGMVCMSQVSSETGDIFEVPKIPAGVVVFVDGAQGFCKEAKPTNADMYSFSGHKIHAPTGIGGLVVRKGLRIVPLMYGGQKGIRPGTENVNGILAMAAAAKVQIEEEKNSKATAIKTILASLSKEMSEVYINHINDSNKVSPYILNMSFVGVRGEVLVNSLSNKGVCVSTGAACRTSKRKSALAALGFSKERAESAIRLSISYTNTEEEAYKAKEIIKQSILELRR